MSFSIISHLFLFLLVSVQNFFFIENLAQKAHSPPKKNSIKSRGFNKAFFEKQLCVTKRPFLDQKPNSEIPVITFWAYSFLFQEQKTKLC